MFVLRFLYFNRLLMFFVTSVSICPRLSSLSYHLIRLLMIQSSAPSCSSTTRQNLLTQDAPEISSESPQHRVVSSSKLHPCHTCGQYTTLQVY